MAEQLAQLCAQCGTAHLDDAHFCSSCGAVLERPAGTHRSKGRRHAAWPPPGANGAGDDHDLAALMGSPQSAPLPEPPVAPELPELQDSSVDEELRDLTDFLSAPVPGAADYVAPTPRTPARVLAQQKRNMQLLVGGAVVTVLVAAIITVVMVQGGADRSKPARTPPPPGTGMLTLEIPTALPSGSVSASLLKDGSIVSTDDGKKLENVPPDTIGGRSFPIGKYIVRFTYRRSRLADVPAEVQDGTETPVGPSRFQLADIEYEAGLKAAREGRAVDNDIDVVHFRRAVQLDPEHVNAHLQLAVYELLNGSVAQVEKQLETVRRLEPKHPDLPRIEKLLKSRLNTRGGA